jgi:hypothetical protein
MVVCPSERGHRFLQKIATMHMPKGVDIQIRTPAVIPAEPGADPSSH